MTQPTRGTKSLLFVIQGWQELVDAGLAAPLRYAVTPDGQRKVDEWKAEGFSPTDEEIKTATQFLLSKSNYAS